MGFFDQQDRQWDLMVDLETLGVKPNAVILSIGACIFTPMHKQTVEELKKHTFYVNIDRVSAEEAGLSVDQSTVRWWEQQSAEARLALENPKPVPLKEAVSKMLHWYRHLPFTTACHWANSPSFDYVKLLSAFEAVGGTWPLRFFNERDVRTVKNILPPKVTIRGTAHNAADDAVFQAQQVQDFFYQLQLLQAKADFYDRELARKHREELSDV